jgi:hypothetical protein
MQQPLAALSTGFAFPLMDVRDGCFSSGSGTRQRKRSTLMLHNADQFATGACSRRRLLCGTWNGIGALALAGLTSNETQAAGATDEELRQSEQAAQAHRIRRAKNCIFLFMAGGVSQLDSFEYKPALQRMAGQRMPVRLDLHGELQGKLDFPHQLIPSAFSFQAHGETGRLVSDLFPHLGTCVDDLAFIHGIKVDNNNHGPATLHLNTGDQFPGSPSVGSWISYGLGSMNQNLPAYMVIQDPRGAPVNGAAVWGNGYLPASLQGTLLRSSGSPILNLSHSRGLSRMQQREELDVLNWLNRRHLADRADDSDLEARIQSYELAWRMQAQAPMLVDLSDETQATRQMYGLDVPATAGFGRQCLLARRLVERGVRYTLLVHGVEIARESWDDHGDVQGRMQQHAAEVDQPVAALLKDLKQRGLLGETLVVWASEMGRTPFHPGAASSKPGRDHNQYGLTMWMAGGDVRAGATEGETDEFGLRSTGTPIPLRDVHATILDLMGLDDEKLTSLHAGRFRRLTDIGGQTLSGIIG